MLTPEERERCRYHLGYLNITEQVALSLGFPSASQLGFILESSMNNLLPEGEPGVRRALQELDCIEDQLSAMRPGLEAKKTGARNPSDTSRTQPVCAARGGPSARQAPSCPCVHRRTAWSQPPDARRRTGACTRARSVNRATVYVRHASAVTRLRHEQSAAATR